nr:hypothetical protein GCM10020093_003330 [Planobispora longispora]
MPGENAVQVLAGTRSGGLTKKNNLLVTGRGGDFGSALAAVPGRDLVVAAPGEGRLTLLRGSLRKGAYRACARRRREPSPPPPGTRSSATRSPGPGRDPGGASSCGPVVSRSGRHTTLLLNFLKRISSISSSTSTSGLSA